MSDLQLDYYYSNEADGYSFYRIPKLLFTDERFKALSIDAKLLYGIMLDRMGLSLKNGWLDKDGKVFIYFTLDEAMEYLGYAHTKIIRVMSELDDKKGVGLIVRKKQGQGKPTIIYVKKFTSKEVLTSQNRNSANAANDVDSENIRGLPQKIDFSTFPHKDEEIQTSENENSRTIKIGSVDLSNCYTNNTKENNTDWSDTQSIYPSVSPYGNEQSQEMQFDGLMDGFSHTDLEELVLDELSSHETLPYHYTADERKMTIAIHQMTEYQHYVDCAKKDTYGESFEFSVVKLFNEALIEMLTTKKPMTLKGSYITYAKVYDKLIPYIKYDASPYGLIYGLQETAIGDFTKACSEQSIKNHLQYMKAVIWNAMQVGDIGIQAMIKKDFG